MINTLRDNHIGKSQIDISLALKADKKDGDDASKKDKNEMLIANPPSFYDKDMEKWKNKFQRHIKEREIYKRNFQKTQELSCLTRNTNIKDDESVGIKSHANPKGKSLDPNKQAGSLFNKVLKRRHSRQSNFAPGVIDFDYTGDSAQFDHLIKQRKDLGKPNSTQLNFELKLRNYKNITDFMAMKPWIFPPVKKFSPRQQWDQRKKDTNLLNPEFKTHFNDTVSVKNTNELIHQYDRHGILSTTMWQCNLRNLKKEKPTTSPQPKKRKGRQE